MKNSKYIQDKVEFGYSIWKALKDEEVNAKRVRGGGAIHDV